MERSNSLNKVLLNKLNKIKQMISFKFLSILFFGMFIFLDSIIINNYLGITFKKYYLKFLSLSFIYQFIIIFNFVFFNINII